MVEDRPEHRSGRVPTRRRRDHGVLELVLHDAGSRRTRRSSRTQRGAGEQGHDRLISKDALVGNCVVEALVYNAFISPWW